jgi:tripartite ATP-independent transporter DctM subunit
MMSAALAPGAAAIVLFGTFLALFVLRVPVAFALGLACLPSLILEPRLSPMMLFNETFKAYNSFILLAVPFYLLTANLMNVGGVTDRLVRLSRSMVGHFPGALAQINVLLSVFFAGISGSSTADAASQSKIFIDAQVKEGYGLSFSIAITAVSAVLAVIIPPSILMIVWGGVISTSIGAMYLAGFLPGLLIAAAQMATVHVYSKIYHYPVYPRATLKEFLYSAWISIPALLTAFIIVGGVLLGWFTPTESACVAVLYTIALSVFVYREMNLKHLYDSFVETGRLSSVALFCVGTASAFGWLLAYYQIPRALLENVSTWGMGITAAGFFIALVFLVVGCFLDAIPAIIIFGTILQPLAQSVGMNPIHFAIIGIVSLAFGLVTPPYGLCLMISCAVAKVPIRFALKDTMIMLVPMLLMLAAIIVWPDIPLILPRLIAPELLK